MCLIDLLYSTNIEIMLLHVIQDKKVLQFTSFKSNALSCLIKDNLCKSLMTQKALALTLKNEN